MIQGWVKRSNIDTAIENQSRLGWSAFYPTQAGRTIPISNGWGFFGSCRVGQTAAQWSNRCIFVEINDFYGGLTNLRKITFMLYEIRQVILINLEVTGIDVCLKPFIAAGRAFAQAVRHCFNAFQ